MKRCTCTERQDKPCLVHPYDCAAEKLTRAIERIQQLTEDHEKDRKSWLSGVNHLKEEHQTEVSKLEQRIQQLTAERESLAYTVRILGQSLC